MRLPPQASQVAAQLLRDIGEVREERKVFALALRAVGGLLGCKSGTIFLYRRATNRLYKVKSLADNEQWQIETVMRFFRNEKPVLPADKIMAPARVGQDVVGVMALSKDGGFERGAGKMATEILRIVGSVLGSRRKLSISLAECAIAKAALSGLDPKDVTYRIFHQVRRFIDYDHGATLIERLDSHTGRVLARQVAWAKGKSDIVGKKGPFAWKELPQGLSAQIIPETARSLRGSFSLFRETASSPRLSIMVGSLCADGDLLGCVEISSQRINFFVDTDVEILSRFLPHLSWCLKEWRKHTGGYYE